jgi:hypothetical protein
MNTIRFNTICALLLMVITPNSHASLLTIDFDFGSSAKQIVYDIDYPLGSTFSVTSIDLVDYRFNLEYLSGAVGKGELIASEFNLELIDERWEVTDVYYSIFGRLALPTRSTWGDNARYYDVIEGDEYSTIYVSDGIRSERTWVRTETVSYDCNDWRTDVGYGQCDSGTWWIEPGDEDSNLYTHSDLYRQYQVTLGTPAPSHTPIPTPATAWLLIIGISMIIAVSPRKNITVVQS